MVRRILFTLAVAGSSAGCAVAVGGAAGQAAGKSAGEYAARKELMNAGILTDQGARQIGITLNEQLVVTDVESNSPAAVAGLERGDLLSRIDGVKINNLRHAYLLLYDSGGGTVHLVVQRADKRPGFTVARRRIPPLVPATQ